MLTKEDEKNLLEVLDETYDYQQSSKNKSTLTFKRKGSNTYDSLPTVAASIAREFKRSSTPYSPDEVKSWLTRFQAKYIEEITVPDYARPKVILGDIGETASWIYEQLHDPKCPIKMSDRGDMIDFVSTGVRVSSNDSIVRAWLSTRVRDMGLRKIYHEGDLDAGWKLLKTKFQVATKCAKNNLVKYTGSTFVNDFLRYIYDYLQIKEEYDVYEMMFKHWMWCLKRRMFDKPVVWHIWLNFAGAQGIGKTQMIDRMFKFIDDFKADTTLRVMNDLDREYRKFTDNYIIFFDELNTGENSDNDVALNDSAVDAIKQIMTQETFTVRQFQTQDQNKVRNTFVPISCANKHLYDIIYDGDAMRRWFEFNCQRDTPPSSYDELNAVLERFPEALQGIDENSQTGYWIKGSETDKKIVEIQKHYIPTNTSTNTWIDYCEVSPDYDRGENTEMRAPEYKQYCTYCRAVGKHAAGLQRVTMILGRLWPECIDDKGIAHVFIEKKIDDTNGKLIDNDMIKQKPKRVDELEENDYIPTMNRSKLSFKYGRSA